MIRKQSSNFIIDLKYIQFELNRVWVGLCNASMFKFMFKTKPPEVFTDSEIRLSLVSGLMKKDETRLLSHIL